MRSYPAKVVQPAPLLFDFALSRRENAFSTRWCNGNTAPFGGVIHGSNPCRVAWTSSMPKSGCNSSGEDSVPPRPTTIKLLDS